MITWLLKYIIIKTVSQRSYIFSPETVSSLLVSSVVVAICLQEQFCYVAHM